MYEVSILLSFYIVKLNCIRKINFRSIIISKEVTIFNKNSFTINVFPLKINIPPNSSYDLQIDNSKFFISFSPQLNGNKEVVHLNALQMSKFPFLLNYLFGGKISENGQEKFYKLFASFDSECNKVIVLIWS